MEGRDRSMGSNVQTVVFKMITVQCYVTAWMGGKFRGEWMHICM